ncbi:uncharacterized protein SAPINGB_P005964 [Magnusiomyces paraingens]|uniref:Mitochondrial import inner membrane translocase subunit TIM54 n=1 Tax=Magnusiomyces paraingens TaxID=2606893 RepID=A0A5E8C2I1_9ASCO|nr:uncharacterized protein SAPINGB_P005964 [Saprochaete ingens]VVT57954.1 unnamed protein product [Saprochaete ingens]
MDSKPTEPAPPAAAPAATEPAASTTASTVPKPPKSKGYTNPALQAMGIPRLRLPSRNWCIFWAVVGGVTGLIVYDRHERKTRRQFWKDTVASFATTPLDTMELPRKVTVYMTPPPNDYLDVTQAHFRQYIKPVLTAAAVDYTVRTESRQGEIRAMVAEEIRNKRRKSKGLPETPPDPKLFKDDVERQAELGITRDPTGGVICIGRGAYKEYLNGLQEGWLGPLDPPAEPVEELQPAVVESLDNVTEASTTQQIVSSPVPIAKTTEKEQEDAAAFPDKDADERDIMGYEEEKPKAVEASTEEASAEEPVKEEEPKDKRPPVTKPYILGMNRGPKVWGPELPPGSDSDLLAASPEEVSEPIAVLEHRHVLGFLSIPVRVKRFFSRHNLSDKLGESTAVVVYNVFRPFYSGSENQEFEPNDRESDVDSLVVEETADWPTRWRQKALDNNSEWIWPLGVDERIASKLRIYDADADLKAKFVELKAQKPEKTEKSIESSTEEKV